MVAATAKPVTRIVNEDGRVRRSAMIGDGSFRKRFYVVQIYPFRTNVSPGVVLEEQLPDFLLVRLPFHLRSEFRVGGRARGGVHSSISTIIICGLLSLQRPQPNPPQIFIRKGEACINTDR